MDSRNLLLKIQYDGSGYHGYQIQPEAITVQKVVEDTLSHITREEIHINGCSRTDAGVHANEYACSFETKFPIPAERLPIVLNGKLPPDIRALSCEQVADDFHARFDTKAKTYRYRINTSGDACVFTRNYEWQLNKKLDILKMQEACQYFVGEKDFASFMTKGNDVKTTIRTIYSLEIIQNGDMIDIFINANGYLYNMVRIITGTLVDVGLGRKNPEDIINIIEAKNREEAGPTAPPQGLYLYKVIF
jgi:tRNA pseudouridine38-40 synthase